MAELEFFGAAQQVTGSMHILHLSDGAVALDCGLFQGPRAWSREMNRTFPVPPRTIRAVLLSHAHIDHSGKIPQLFRYNYNGPVYATPATCDLCDVMLLDSAHIHEEDARFWNERRARSKDEEIEPLYTQDDARRASKHFQCVPYEQQQEFAPGCTVRFIEAGHILGSACVVIELNGQGPKQRILYTGDLGRFDIPILRDPANPLPEVDYLITESTYAGKRHTDASGMGDSLAKIIAETRARGGKVIIPAFSVGRTQNIVYCLSLAMAEGKIEPLPIFVDSPLSTSVTEVFRKHPECYDAEAREFWLDEGGIFGQHRVTYITAVEESKALNELHDPAVIIAASGMCEHGRILHHLKNNVEDERNTVVIVGYQAKGTLGRRIVEHEPELKIFGRKYHLEARVEVLNGFSAHADEADFERLLAPIAPKLKAAFVVHGENDRLEHMQRMLSEAGCKEVIAPEPGQRFPL